MKLFEYSRKFGKPPFVIDDSPRSFADAFPALAHKTLAERAKSVAVRAGLRGAFGTELPHAPGTRSFGKQTRRVAPFKLSVRERRKLSSR